MERERWLALYALILKVAKPFESGWKYPTSLIAAVWFWAALHDRPVSWACRRGNWPPDLAPTRLPTQDRMSKRLKTQSVRGLLNAVEAAEQTVKDEPIKAVDSKPLTVGVSSKDADAKWGCATGGCYLRGYKFHAIWGSGTLPITWRVTSMNVQDGRGAAPLFDQLTGYGCVLGDGQYDQNVRYEQAAAHGHQLIAYPRCPNAGKGHRRQSPHRLRGLKLVKRWRRWVDRWRGRIEQSFGGLTCSSGCLGTLPAWIRGITRVTLWVQAKLIINAQRLKELRTPSLATA